MIQEDVLLGDLITPARIRRADQQKLPILSMTMHNGLVDQSAKFKKRIASLDTSTYKVVARGQLVVGFPIDEGVLSFQEKHHEAIVSPAYDIWDIVDPERISRSYLERFLRSPRALNYYRGKLQGTTARRRSLPKDTFLELPVHLPKLSDQKRIAQVLDHVDALRAKRRETLALLDDLVQSIFLDTFGEPRINPEGWPTCWFGDTVTEFRYGTSNKSGPQGYPALRIPNILGGSINISEIKKVPVSDTEFQRLRLADGDLLFVRTNGNPDNVGRCAVFDERLISVAGHCATEFIYASYLIRARIQPDLLHPVYAREYFLSPAGRAALRANSKTSAGQFNINIQGLSHISLMTPPIELQELFACRVGQVEKIKQVHRSHLVELDSLLASIQHRAFRGEL